MSTPTPEHPPPPTTPQSTHPTEQTAKRRGRPRTAVKDPHYAAKGSPLHGAVREPVHMTEASRVALRRATRDFLHDMQSRMDLFITTNRSGGVRPREEQALIITDLLRWMAGQYATSGDRTPEVALLKDRRVGLVQVLMDIDKAGETELATWLGMTPQRVSQMRHGKSTARSKGIKAGPGRPTEESLKAERSAMSNAKSDTRQRQVALRQARRDAYQNQIDAEQAAFAHLRDTLLTAQERSELTPEAMLDLLVERARTQGTDSATA